MEIFSEQLKKDHRLSKVDARLKLGISLFLLAMVLSYKGIIFPLLILCLSLAIGIRIGVPLKIFLIRFSEPLFIASVLVLLKLFFSGQEEIFSLKILGITIKGHKEGLMDGLQIGSRILGAVSIISVLGFSTPFIEIMAALSWMKVPKGLIEILMFAYRYIFVLFEDAMIIYNAQKNRLGYSNIRRGLGSFGILTGSLILKAFDHSHNITISMIQRGYEGDIPMLRHKPLKVSEVLVSVLFTAVIGILWRM
jgi:cobalt/nickel transport system permease protein